MNYIISAVNLIAVNLINMPQNSSLLETTSSAKQLAEDVNKLEVLYLLKKEIDRKLNGNQIDKLFMNTLITQI